MACHLQVEMTEDQMHMLYKIGDNLAAEAHYGLTLARVINLPPLILKVAEDVSKNLEARAARKRQSGQARALVHRRKLILGLQESLNQAQEGPMDDDTLLGWMKELQREFVLRMEAIEAAAVKVEDEDLAVD